MSPTFISVTRRPWDKYLRLTLTVAWSDQFSRTDLSSATLSLASLVLSVSSLACRLAEERLADIEEVTAYFSDEKYSGEILSWTSRHGAYQALVRPSQHQVNTSLGINAKMDQIFSLLQVSFSPGYSGLLSRSIRQIKVGSNWDEREKIFRYQSSLTLLSSIAFNQNINPNYSFSGGWF